MTKILSRYETQLPLDGIFISCDSGYNKKSGRLFSYIESQLHITPSEHFHLGDNKKADVEIPKKMGINSIQYLPEQEQKQRELKELHYKQRLEGNLEGYLEKVKKYLPGQGRYIILHVRGNFLRRSTKKLLRQIYFQSLYQEQKC